jgi:amidase
MGPLVGELPGGMPHEFALVRTVRDAALLLDAVCGPAAGDRYYVAAPPHPFVETLDADPGRLRVAIHTQAYWGRETEPEPRAAVETVGRQLEQLGHTVEPASAPINAERLRTAHLILYPWLLAIEATGLGALVGREASEDTVEAASLACIRRGMELTATDVWTALGIQNGLSRAWGTFLDEYDLFVCPTCPTSAPSAGYPPQNDHKYSTAEAWIDEVFDLIPFTPIANTTGQPSVSLPLGVTSDGLPLGVMLTTQALREDLLFSVAAQLEQAMPWADRTPEVVAR